MDCNSSGSFEGIQMKKKVAKIIFWINAYEDKCLGLHYTKKEADEEAKLEGSGDKYGGEPPRHRLGKAQKFVIERDVE